MSHKKAAPGVSADESTTFVREVRDIVGDLTQPRQVIYWTDFLLTITAAYIAFATYLRAAGFSVLQIGALVLCGLALYRSVVFTHEISHRAPGGFRAFHWTWNLLCGIPLLMPSFLYGDHNSHHSNRSYGTPGDAEYVFLNSGRWRAVVFLLLSLVYPVLGPLRFLLLTPLSIIAPAIDRVVWRYTSSLYMMNPGYRRDYGPPAASPARWVQEVACCLWVWCIACLTWSGTLPLPALVKTYVVFLFWMALNQLRTLAAHRYSHDGKPPSYVDQALDSNTFPRGVFVPELWAPLGLRYHALHHVLPSLPYHAMGKAHQRLMRYLPLDSPYRQTLQPGLWGAVIDALGGPRTSSRIDVSTAT